jgi:hypothetical protein
MIEHFRPTACRISRTCTVFQAQKQPPVQTSRGHVELASSPFFWPTSFRSECVSPCQKEEEDDSDKHGVRQRKKQREDAQRSNTQRRRRISQRLVVADRYLDLCIFSRDLRDTSTSKVSLYVNGAPTLHARYRPAALDSTWRIHHDAAMK